MILNLLLASLFIGCAFGQAAPLGNIDVANATLVAGWTCDPDNFNRPVQVEIYIDNNIFAGFVVANLPREAAVGAQCGGVNRHGFSFSFPANVQQLLSNGQPHTVSVIARPFPPQGPRLPIPGSPVTVQVTTQPNRNPIGVLDVANATIVSGWACDPDVFSQALRVDIYVDNAFVGSTTANLQRESAVGAQCGGNNNRGFSFTFPAATQQLLSNGQSHTVQAYAINVPTGNNPQLTGSPKTVLVQQPNRNPLGNLDIANATIASGWACDPDAFSQALRVDIYVDNAFVGSTTANLQRESAVGAQCGGNNNRGFSFTFPAATQQLLSNGQSHTVQVYAINVPTGNNPQIAGSPKTVLVPIVRTNPPIGFLDIANATLAAGWACDPDAFNEALRVDIYVDNTFVGSTTANLQREAAIGAQCGGNNNRGFSFTFPAATQQLLSNGQSHTVQVYAINVPTGNNPQLSGSPKTVLVQQPNRNPLGNLDVANATIASGWACDPDAFSQALRVDIYVDNTFVGSTTANLPRESAVGAQCGGNNNRGFSFTFPAATQQLLSNGQPHTVQVYAINVPTGNNPQIAGSPKTVQVQQQTNRAPTGFLDFANRTLASGWACDPDNFAESLRIDIYIGEPQRYAGSTTANIPREAGVSQACGGSPNHGWVFVFAPGFQPGTVVHAYAINTPTGTNPELAGSPKTVA